MTDVTTIKIDELENVKGGFDIAGLVGGITGAIDKATGGKYDVSGKANSIMGLISQFKGAGNAG